MYIFLFPCWGFLANIDDLVKSIEANENLKKQK